MRKQDTLPKHMILIDLDGTLLNNNKKIGHKDIKTLEKLGTSGTLRVFATGRTLYSALKVLSDSTPFDYLVFSSGAGIVDWRTQKIIYQVHLNKIQINETIKILRNLEVNFSIQEPIPENHQYFYHQAKKTNTDFEWRNNLYRNYATELNADYPFEQATQFLVILENEIQFEIVKNKIPDLKVIRATSPIDGKSVWLEIFPENVSKAAGGKYLCKMLDISQQNTLAIGNDYNDIDMLEWTNKSFVVANSPKILREKFMVCTDNENNPLTNVIREL